MTLLGNSKILLRYILPIVQYALQSIQLIQCLFQVHLHFLHLHSVFSHQVLHRFTLLRDEVLVTSYLLRQVPNQRQNDVDQVAGADGFVVKRLGQLQGRKQPYHREDQRTSEHVHCKNTIFHNTSYFLILRWRQIRRIS